MVSTTFSNLLFAKNLTSEICVHDKVVKTTSFYKIYEKAPYSIKYKSENKVESIYRLVDSAVANAIYESCKLNQRPSDILESSYITCIKQCDIKANEIYSDKMFVKEKIFEIVKDCTNICESMNNRNKGFLAGYAIAAENDCVNPSKDSVTTIGRSAKDIQDIQMNSNVKEEPNNAIQK